MNKVEVPYVFGDWYKFFTHFLSDKYLETDGSKNLSLKMTKDFYNMYVSFIREKAISSTDIFDIDDSIKNARIEIFRGSSERNLIVEIEIVELT